MQANVMIDSEKLLDDFQQHIENRILSDDEYRDHIRRVCNIADDPTRPVAELKQLKTGFDYYYWKYTFLQLQKRKPLVIVESPFMGSSQAETKRHIKYAKQCVRDSIDRGEAPLAFHLLYTHKGILNDRDPRERALGIVTSFEWHRKANVIAVYEDLGISAGMKKAIEQAERGGFGKDIQIEYRRLGCREVDNG